MLHFYITLFGIIIAIVTIIWSFKSTEKILIHMKDSSDETTYKTTKIMAESLEKTTKLITNEFRRSSIAGMYAVLRKAESPTLNFEQLSEESFVFAAKFLSHHSNIYGPFDKSESKS